MLFNRMPGQMMMPRPNFSANRTLLSHEMPFFNDPTMPPFSHMNLPMPPFPFGGQIRGQGFDSMYGMNSRAGPLAPNMIPFANSMPLTGLNGGVPMMDSESGFYQSSYKYDDYDDKVERFNRQLESRSRRDPPRRYSRSRSPSRDCSKSRSRFVTYNFLFSRFRVLTMF